MSLGAVGEHEGCGAGGSPAAGGPEGAEASELGPRARARTGGVARGLAGRGSGHYLVKQKNIPAPYIVLGFDTASRQNEIAAAIHSFDRSARPQEVCAECNPSCHALIKEFECFTGIGALFNTSFNLHGYPIVSRPDDALDIFDHSGLTRLAIGNWLIEKR